MLAAPKKISSFHSADSWSNEIAAASSHSNTEPLERREVCLFQYKVWTKIIAGLEIVATFYLAAVLLNSTPSPRHGCSMDWKPIPWCAHGMTRKHVEMYEGIRTAQLLNAEGISPSEMASKNDMKYVAMSTEKTETTEMSTGLKDWRSRDCDKGNRRLYYVALGVGFSIAVNTMLLIGNAKEKRGLFWPWIVVECTTFLGAALYLFWVPWFAIVADAVLVTIYSAKKILCLYALNQRMQEIQEIRVRKNRARFFNPWHRPIEIYL